MASTDWSAVRSLAEIDVFAEHIARTEALVSALEPYDVIVAMRERTFFDAARLGQLPRLRLLVTTGMSNTSIDLAATTARGVTVCGTGGVASATAELTWGLILALLRHIPEEDRRLKLAGRAGGAALGFGGGWQRTVGTGLDGKRLGVVGLGNQGRKVAEIGRAFGMKVVAWSQNLDPAVAEPVPPVPHTVTPRSAAAAISMAALPMPVVTSSRSRGSWPSVAASKGVRSRIATITSYGSRALTSASVREMCSANTSIWPSERTADQSVLAREIC